MCENFYSKKIDELLDKTKAPCHLIVSPVCTIILFLFMLIVLFLLLSYVSSLWPNRTLTKSDYFTFASDVLMFGGTILSLWETLQAASRQHALFYAREADALINTWEEKAIAHEIYPRAPEDPLVADIVRPDGIPAYREKVAEINKTVEADIKFAGKAVIVGVSLMLIGLLLTVAP